MRLRYLWDKLSHIPATTEGLHLFQVWYYQVLFFLFPLSLCYFLFVLSFSYLPSSVISSPSLPIFTVYLFSLSLPFAPLYFSPFVPPLLCPPHLCLLRLFLLNTLLIFPFAVFSFQSSFIFPSLHTAFYSSSNSTCVCSSFLAGLRVDERAG
jgi:hypothetical protein